MTRPRTTRPALTRGWKWVVFCVFWPLAVGPIAAAEPNRPIPAKELSVYVEYDGVDAHADAWKATAAHAMFADTTAGAMTAEIARQVVDRLLKALPDHEQVSADLFALQEHVAREGFALGLYDEADRGASHVAILHGLGRADARARVGRLAGFALRARANEKADAPGVETTRFRGRDLSWIKDVAALASKDQRLDLPEAIVTAPKPPPIGLVWWFEGDDLIVVSGPSAPEAVAAKDDAHESLPTRVVPVLDTIAAKAPSVAAHPGRAAALAEGKEIPGFEPHSLFFVEVGPLQAWSTRLSEFFETPKAPPETLTMPSRHLEIHVTPAPAVPVARPIQPPGILSVRFPTDDSPPVVGEEDHPQPRKPVPAPTPSLPIVVAPPPPPPPPVETAPPPPTLTVETAPPPPPAPKDAERDPAVAKSGMIPERAPVAKTKTKPKEDALKNLGLEDVKRIVGRGGFQGKALLTIVRVEAPAPRKGLLGAWNSTSFRKDHLPPVPRGSAAFLIGACDPAATYDALLSRFATAISGASAHDLGRTIDLFVFEMTGQRLHEDLLGHFGPTWSLYANPSSKDGKTDAVFPTLLVDLDDPKGFGEVLDGLAKRFNASFGSSSNGEDGKPDADPPTFALEPLPAPDRGYRLTAPSGAISWLSEGMQPTLLIGESHVALAANPAQARAALALASRPDERWEPSGELARAWECLPETITSLTVGDPSQSTWPSMVVYLPRMVQHMASGFEAIEEIVPDTSPRSKFLGLMGVPRPGGFHLRIDPARMPRIEALESRLFPSVLATAVDDQGVRVIAREALPFACAGPGFRVAGNSKNGERLTMGLKAFLFPSVQVTITHDLKSDQYPYHFTISWNWTLRQ